LTPATRSGSHYSIQKNPICPLETCAFTITEEVNNVASVQRILTAIFWVGDIIILTHCVPKNISITGEAPHTFVV
jgi:hypothetical protein